MAALTLLTVDSLALSVVQARIGTALHASAGMMQWALVGSCLTWAVLLRVGCVLRSRHGDRAVFTVGQLLLAASCATAAAAHDGNWLLAGRVGQGAAAALIAPVALAQLGDSFPQGPTGLPAPLAQGVTELSAGLGALGCAGIAASAGWRWIFWLDAGLCLASVLLARPAGRAGSPMRRTFDPLGTLVFAVGAGCLVWALTEGDRGGWGSAPILVCLAVGAVLLGYHASGRTPLGGFHSRELIGLRLAYACGCAAQFGAAFVLAAHYAPAAGEPLRAWLRLAPFYAGLAACAALSGALARRVGSAALVVGALGASTAGLGMLALGTACCSPYALQVAPLAVSGGGIGSALPETRRLVLGSRTALPGEPLAGAGALHLLAGALGIALCAAACGGRPLTAGAYGASGTPYALTAAAGAGAAGCAAAIVATVRSRPPADRES